MTVKAAMDAMEDAVATEALDALDARNLMKFGEI